MDVKFISSLNFLNQNFLSIEIAFCKDSDFFKGHKNFYGYEVSD